MLSALDAEPSIQSGALYTRDGALLASYTPRERVRPIEPDALAPGTHFAGRTVRVVRVIVYDHERRGTVAIRAGLDELQTRVAVFASVTFGIVIVCSLLALGLSRGLQRSITDPILGSRRCRISTANAGALPEPGASSRC